MILKGKVIRKTAQYEYYTVEIEMPADKWDELKIGEEVEIERSDW